MEISSIINNSKQILIIGHLRPDGDCLGAGLSLLYLAENMGKHADFVCDSDYPLQYSFMHGFDKLGKLRFLSYDTVICVDCGDQLRLGRYIKYFNQARLTINIDHHITNIGFAKENLVLPAASSTCEILGNMYIREGLMDKTTAELIYVGISTDSGHFSHDNTTIEVFELAANLLKYGVDSYSIVRHLYRSVTVNKLKLIVRAIQSMRFFQNENICIISLKSSDIKECGCNFDDTEGIINYAINLKSVELAACIAESAENAYKVSFRSKVMDVSPVALKFGGGGHKHAAGCMVFGKYEDVIDKVSRALGDELGG